MAEPDANKEHGPWNPGLASSIPQRLMPMVTLYRAENATLSYAKARERHESLGFTLEEMATFKTSRLIIHELLIRVTADLSVRDGPNYEDLGINLRAMVERIFQHYAKPELMQFEALVDDWRERAQAFAKKELADRVFLPPPPILKDALPSDAVSWIVRFWSRLPQSQKKPQKAPKDSTLEQRSLAAMANWKERAAASADKFQQACLESLVKVVGTIMGHCGRLLNDPELIAELTAGFVCNNYGSAAIGAALQPIIEKAAKAEGYRFLPIQAKPLVMNVKGASAAGKSTIRLQQSKLAARIDVPWEDFALISPDYWRKYLLDYDSLGADKKYAAMLTGRELEIIDKKLDRHMAEKAQHGKMSHLLIDRFRFDSFVTHPMKESDSRLLSRFGETIYLFFMITPPEQTVERAWVRGLATGRYKAVDDLLYHNIEAYNGMPQLFFSWVVSGNKKVHYEFLDNSVEKGQRPRTIAFGWNTRMTILDLEQLDKIDRYKDINIHAKNPDDIYAGQQLAGDKANGFLNQCLKKIATIILADHTTGDAYARIDNARCTAVSSYDRLQLASNFLPGLDLAAITPQLTDMPDRKMMQEEARHTVGQWANFPVGEKA